MTDLSSAAPSSPLRLGAIILAAGSSSRLGQPKQLVAYKGTPLVVRAAQAALEAGASPVVVVLGANVEKIRPALVSLPILIAENSTWSEGMASSLRTGLAALESSAPTLDAVLIALCDQPHFSADSIGRLQAAFSAQPPATIAATRHTDGGGVPAIFTRAHCAAIAALRGAEGARRIIAAHTTATAFVDLPELAFDIDTPADLQRLAPPS